jgi:hypothetical protein
MALRADSDDFFAHHELVGFYDRDGAFPALYELNL